MADINDVMGYTAVEATSGTPLNSVLYFIPNPPKPEYKFVKLEDNEDDTGYVLKSIPEDEAILNLGVNEVVPTGSGLQIISGEWSGVKMSNSDEDLLPLLSILMSQYVEDHKDEQMGTTGNE